MSKWEKRRERGEEKGKERGDERRRERIERWGELGRIRGEGIGEGRV